MRGLCQDVGSLVMTNRKLDGVDGKLQILIVEDNPGDVLLVREALNESNLRYDLNHVSDGEKAVNFLQHRGEYKHTFKPDLVLLDLNLPKRSGWEVFDEMRSEEDLRDVPVVILSSSGAPEDRRRAERASRSIYIQKPADFEEFLRIGQRIEEFVLRQQ